MKSGNFSNIIKWITGIVFLFSISCKDREWEFQATVSTNEITVFSDVAAVVGGTLINDGHSVVTETGVCYSQLPNPDLDDNRINLAGGLNEFSGKIESLETGTTYYMRAYAINGKGISYGEKVSFKTDQPLTDVDGNEYKTVIIGDQVWMAENLRTTKYRNGSEIPLVSDKDSWAGLSTGAYCYFGNSTSNGAVYGGLYNFFAVVDNRGLCPTGWHMPSDSEWMTLRDYLGGENVAGGKLKETGLEHWDDPNVGADNISGFTALGGSWRGTSGPFYYHTGYTTYFWSSSVDDSSNPVFYELAYNSSNFVRRVGNVYFLKNAGLSIRCIKY